MSQRKKERVSFVEWKAYVNAEIIRLVGIDADGIPDWDYYDAYQSGMTPKQAAKEAIKAAKDF